MPDTLGVEKSVWNSSDGKTQIQTVNCPCCPEGGYVKPPPSPPICDARKLRTNYRLRFFPGGSGGDPGTLYTVHNRLCADIVAPLSGLIYWEIDSVTQSGTCAEIDCLVQFGYTGDLTPAGPFFDFTGDEACRIVSSTGGFCFWGTVQCGFWRPPYCCRAYGPEVTFTATQKVKNAFFMTCNDTTFPPTVATVTARLTYQINYVLVFTNPESVNQVIVGYSLYWEIISSTQPGLFPVGHKFYGPWIEMAEVTPGVKNRVGLQLCDGRNGGSGDSSGSFPYDMCFSAIFEDVDMRDAPIDVPVLLGALQDDVKGVGDCCIYGSGEITPLE